MDPICLLLAVLLFSLLGTVLGATGGLVPGLHINNLAYLIGASAGTLVASSLWLFGPFGATEPEGLLLVAALIIASLTAHTFTSILPSVFLGAPDPGRALSVLPAHRLLLAGRGFDAVRCSLIGCVGGLAVCLAALPIFRLAMGDPVEAYAKLKPFMALILLLIIGLLVISEPRGRNQGRGRCVLWLTHIRMAELVLHGNADRFDEEVGGTVCIRPWMAPKHAGMMVCVAGMVSEVRENGGRRSFILEEGGRLDVLVPDGIRELSVKAGDIVFAEGRVASAVGWGFGARRKLLALAIFLASGLLGLLVLESGRVGADNWFPLGSPPVPEAVMMFPLFCGLFGLPTILLGLLEHPGTPPQELAPRPLGLRRAVRGVLSGALAGGIMGWYPGMTSAHGSVLAKLFCGEDDERGPPDDGGRSEDERPLPDAAGSPGDGTGSAAAKEQDSAREFLISVSAVTMANAFFNIVALFVIMRARSGALHMAQEVLGDGMDRWAPASAVPPAFALLAFSAAVAAMLAYPLTLYLGKKLAQLYDRVPYRRLIAGIVCFLLALLFVFSGITGLAVTGIAISLGLIPPLAGVRRVHLMGSILVPVIIYFTGAGPGVMAFLGF